MLRPPTTAVAMPITTTSVSRLLSTSRSASPRCSQAIRIPAMISEIVAATNTK
jgi:hypothetical protein